MYSSRVETNQVKSSQERHTLEAAPKTSDHFCPLGLGMNSKLQYKIEDQPRQTSLRLLTNCFQPASDPTVAKICLSPASW